MISSIKQLLLATGLMLLLPVISRAEPLPEIADNSEKATPTIIERFQNPDIRETPSFQKHVIPLMGRLGCNGRSCHGSFQGRGGFVLSLFGYDFEADHQAIAGGDEPRVVTENADESLIIFKPTDEYLHEGGKRYDLNSWEHRVFRNWVKNGAKFDKAEIAKLKRLEVTPSEILFSSQSQTQPLRVVAIWEDGSREDVTPLCRYTTNDDQVAGIDGDGIVSSANRGDTHVVVAYDKAVVAVPVIRPMSELVGESYPEVDAPTKVDQLIIQKLRKLGIVPSGVSSDEQFLRRVSLDIAGTLPTPAEIKNFVADASSDKREKKINELLETPAYAAKWATLLCDITGNNDNQLNNISPVRSAPAQEWYDWISDRVQRNVPYDDIVEGILMATSRAEGESYEDYCETMSTMYRDETSFAQRESMPHYWARRDFRQTEERAIAVAYAFMGVRIQCAQCHKHPFDVWSKQDFDEFKTFFAGPRFSRIPARNDKEAMQQYEALIANLEVNKNLKGNQLNRELAKFLRDGKTVPFPELVSTTPPAYGKNKKFKGKALGSRKSTAKILGEEAVDLSDYDDARQPIMEWLRRSDNRYFARAFVNRVWANYFNVGIVHPTDDMSLGNPPSNEALLEYLALGFIENDFDMKWLHREIANSATYQRTWVPNETNRMDQRNFSRAVPRRLPAEVAYDIIQQATSGDKEIESFLTDIDRRAIAVPGTRVNGSIAYPLAIFGRSERVSNCDCDRSEEATLLQTVFLQNDFSMHSAMSDSKSWLGQMRQSNGNDFDRDVKKLEQRMKQLYTLMGTSRNKLEEFERKGNKKAVDSMTQRMEMGKQRLKDLRKQLTKAKQRVAQAEAEIAKVKTPAEIVDLAYLRTLSRLPTENEKKIALSHIEDASQPMTGLQDLMWALLNTKEFIVNH